MKTILPLLVASFALGQGLPADQQTEAREILRELIDTNTTDSVGDTARAAEAVAARLLAAGFPKDDVRVLPDGPRKGNLVVRYRGAGSGKPILFLAHLDVVEARREDWSVDPFHMVEQDGYFYGRGSNDDKSGDADLIANLVRLKREGFQPQRDLVVALTTDEEGGTHNGVKWLLATHRDLIDAEFCINTDAGGGELDNGKHVALDVSGAEKGFQSYRLEVKNSGGHSSLPTRDNAIYRLAQALTRISQYTFPVQMNDVTREYFRRMSEIQKGPFSADMKAVTEEPVWPGPVSRLSASPYYNALLRTTCVATMLSAGHAENALPQTATAIINCRLVPGDTADNVEKTLKRVIATPVVSVTPLESTGVSTVTPPSPEVLEVITSVAHETWPGVPVVPTMDTGASDGKYTRLAGIPTYGVSAVFDDVNDVRAHGRDERIGVQPYYDSVEYYYRLMKALGGVTVSH